MNLQSLEKLNDLHLWVLCHINSLIYEAFAARTFLLYQL